MPKFFVSIRDENDMTIFADDNVIACDAATARYKVGCDFLAGTEQRKQLFGADTRDNLRGCRILSRRKK